MRIHPLLLAIALMTSSMATADVVGAAAPPSPPVPGETRSDLAIPFGVSLNPMG